MLPLQTGVTGGGPLAIVVTFLLVAAFYAVTLHLAATFFIGDVPSQRAAYVAPAPASASLLLQQWGLRGFGPLSPSLAAGIAILGILVADLIAISYVYRLQWSSALPLALLHFGFAAVLGVALNNIFGLL
ncbi:DUF7473 family protein [Halorientalis regularis]|jgi:hypothetical protein|uniref:Yip1 domain-containing protein n=1 Tax=Halorientalis regularis TaxID=660518 RepID=A0A1G7H141_9EURY|nr:hypothetical protein [Halorientalis regularis]SDE94061.1 hypothetical protein SAMN05216218_102278 [Halorientalis regularis]